VVRQGCKFPRLVAVTILVTTREKAKEKEKGSGELRCLSHCAFDA